MPAVKMINRPEVVHQLRDVKGSAVSTKCGLAGKKDKLRTTVWHTDVTCDECSP